MRIYVPVTFVSRSCLCCVYYSSPGGFVPVCYCQSLPTMHNIRTLRSSPSHSTSYCETSHETSETNIRRCWRGKGTHSNATTQTKRTHTASTRKRRSCTGSADTRTTHARQCMVIAVVAIAPASSSISLLLSSPVPCCALCASVVCLCAYVLMCSVFRSFFLLLFVVLCSVAVSVVCCLLSVVCCVLCVVCVLCSPVLSCLCLCRLSCQVWSLYS